MMRTVVSAKTKHGTHFYLHGDPTQKPPVVLIHGVGLEQTIWNDIVALLSAECTPVTYDLLGHGKSHNPDGARDISDFTTQLRDLADQLGLQRMTVIGFSLGALIAQAFAATYPDRVSHLALLHAVYRRSTSQRTAVRERYRFTLQHGAAATVEAAIARWFSPSAQDSDAAKMVREMFARHHGDGYQKAYRLFANHETQMRRHPPRKITCPTYVITGADDSGSTASMSRALASEMPNARVMINPKHRHMAVMEHPETLAAQIKMLLRGE